MRVCYFDLETTALISDLGRLLVASMLTHEGEMVTFRQDRQRKKRDFSDDTEICRKTRDVLEDHDMLVAWYGKGFDSAFLNTRLVQNGDRIRNPKLFLDPCFQMRGWRGLKPRNSKLATASEFFGLDEGKMAVPIEVWARAQTGNRAALDILAERCESDVRILKEVTDRILRVGIIKNVQTY